MKNCIDLYTLTSGFEEVNAHFLVESSLFLLWWGLFRLPIPDVGVSTERSLFSNCWYVIEISAIWRKQRAFLMLSVALHRHLLVFCYSVLQNPLDSVSTSVFSGNFSISAPFFFFFVLSGEQRLVLPFSFLCCDYATLEHPQHIATVHRTFTYLDCISSFLPAAGV